MNQRKFLGFSFVAIMLVLLWSPMVEYFNALPSSTTLTAIGLFFWAIMGMTFIYSMGQALQGLLE